MRLLVVAANKMEFDGLLAAASGASRPTLAVRWARETRAGENSLLLVANGVGVKCAAAAVSACATQWKPQALVSYGFCGAVEPSLGTGDVVVASAVSSSEGDYPAHRIEAKRAYATGVIRTIARVAQTAAEKREWRATGAVAVEMEAAAVGRRALQMGLPFYCLRSVTDMAGEDMFTDFNSALRPDGRFDTIKLLGSSLRRPWIGLPELVRLRKRCMLASNSLGGFIANCRF